MTVEGQRRVTKQQRGVWRDAAAPLRNTVVTCHRSRRRTWRRSVSINQILFLADASNRTAADGVFHGHEGQSAAFAHLAFNLKNLAAPCCLCIDRHSGEVANPAARPHAARQFDGRQKTASARMTVDAQGAAASDGVEVQPLPAGRQRITRLGRALQIQGGGHGARRGGENSLRAFFLSADPGFKTCTHACFSWLIDSQTTIIYNAF